MIVAFRARRLKRQRQFARFGEVAGGDQRHEIMKRREGERGVLRASRRDLRRPGPPAADIDAELLDPRQQGDGVRHVAEIVAGARPDFAVVKVEHMRDSTEFELKQGRVPAHMKREIVAMGPGGAPGFDPRQPVGGASRHLVNVANSVDGPGILGFEIHRLPAKPLGGVVGPQFLKREGPAAEREAVARMVLRQRDQRAVDAGQHAERVARHEAQGMRQLGGDEAFGMIDQMGVEPVRAGVQAP